LYEIFEQETAMLEEENRKK